MAIENLTTATPSEIDEKLFELYQNEGRAKTKQEMAVANLHRVAGDKGTYVTRTRKVPSMKFSEALEIVVRMAYRTELPVFEAQRALEIWVKTEDTLQAVRAEMAPLEEEFSRRGGWSRYFLVTNENGHIHRSMQCSTCNRDGQATRFAWLTEHSGKAEETLTDEVGPTACTVCFPWAETIRVEHEAKVRAEKAAAKEAEKAEKARIAAEKGILTPEGKPLDLGRHGYRDIAGSLRTAEIFATDILVDLIQEKKHSVDPEYAWMYENGCTTEDNQSKMAHLAWWVIRAIAAKKDQTFEETFQVHEKKAQAKVRKIERDWAKDPRNPNRTK